MRKFITLLTICALCATFNAVAYERNLASYLRVESDPSTHIYVDATSGENVNGNGSMLSPYKTIAKAFTAVTATRKHVVLAQGSHATPAAGLVWPQVSGVVLEGATSKYSTIIVGHASADEAIAVAPTIAGTFELWMINIHLDHSTAGQDGLKITNALGGGKILAYLHNFGADADSATDKSIITDHTLLDTEAIRIYADGDNGGIAGNIFFDVENASDRLYLTGISLPGAVTTSADAIAGTIRLIGCWNLPAGAGLSVTGGNAAQTVAMIGCYTDAPAISAIADVASQTETIVGG